MKKEILKKVASLTVIVVMLIVMLSACGSKEEGGSAGGDTGTTTIVFESHVGNPEEQAPQLWQATQKFMEENPNIKIEINGNTDIGNKVKLAAQSDTLPDIFWSFVDDAKQYIQRAAG